MNNAKELIEENLKTKNPFLDLGNCGLDGTEDYLQLLTKMPYLRKLYLRNNMIYNISFIQNLRELTFLNLYKNKLRNLPPLQDLMYLKNLSLAENQIQDISSIEKLENLRSLNLSQNQIQDISSLRKLEKLENLNLSQNQIQDISSIEKLENLEGLYIGDNQIQDILPIRDLKKLQALDLENNRIKEVSLVFVNSLPNLKSINIYGNPIQNIPKEIFDIANNTLEDVRNFLIQQARELNVDYLWEGKMILVGNGEVGKSSIRKKLLDKNANLPQKEDRTKGIDLAINTYPVPIISPIQMIRDSGKNFQLHIWDFGGQGRYREVQQLFCSRKSLYLFITSYDDQPHQEDYIGFEYWLSMVNAFNYDPDTKNHSPVIHVLNKIDKNSINNFNEEERRESFPNIQAFCKISALSLQNFEDLEKAIQNTLPLVSEDIFTTAFPKTWLDIKEELENQAKQGINHILWKDYLVICEILEVNESAASTLIRTLDRMGYVIYYGNHPQLKNWIILNPLWVKDAIYRVLDSKYILEAKYYPEQFELVWDEYEVRFLEEGVKTLGETRRYTKEEHEQFLNLLLAYDFCYEQHNSRGNIFYIIPALFGEKPLLPEYLQKFDYEIKFIFEPFIPAGTVNKLIVRLHKRIFEGDYYWKNGAIFQIADIYGLIQEVWEERTVYLKLKGEKVKSLYNQIYQTLFGLNQQLRDTKFLKKLEFKTQVKYKGSWKSIQDVIDFRIKDYEFVLRDSFDEEDKQEGSSIKSIKEKLFDLLNEYELAELFEKLDELGIRDPHLGKMKKEFKQGKDDVNFIGRLKSFVNDLEID